MPGTKILLALLASALALVACDEDPVGVAGPRGTWLMIQGTGTDSPWVALPGADTLVRVRVFDLRGAPVHGAVLSWEATGNGSQVTPSVGRSDPRGFAAVSWRVGTDASEQPELLVTSRFGDETPARVVIRGRLAPGVVDSLRLANPLPIIAHVGDTVRMEAEAVDPFGNVFVPEELAYATTDSAIGTVLGGLLVAGPHRGTGMVEVGSGGRTAQFPISVVQRVGAIETDVDTLRFFSLLAEAPVPYVVLDERGAVITDTMPALRIADRSVARRSSGVVRAVGPGVTAVTLLIGDVQTSVPIKVEQRMASLTVAEDTVRFDALSASASLSVSALDSLGSSIAGPAVVFETSDSSIVRVSGATLQAIGRGDAVVTARDPITGLSTSVDVVVRQTVATVASSPSSLRFDAIGDSLHFVAVPLDRLGSVVADAALEYVVDDTTIVTIDPITNQVRSVASGIATLTVTHPATGVSATLQVEVFPVVQSLSVEKLDPEAVLRLSAGDAVAFACRATDRNGFPVTGHSAITIRSTRATVTGSCDDATARGSGYDTLIFTLGAAEARVPVIVATRPDSVGVLRTAVPLSEDRSRRFEGEDLDHPSIRALDPLVRTILNDYGSPTSDLDRARALRDWVARTVIHPEPALHPDGSTANQAVLPLGEGWADVNALAWRQAEDGEYWWQQPQDGYLMLNRLLGTLDPVTGIRADDGMMVHLSGAQYRIRDVRDYRYLLCSYQATILNALWAAAGLHGTVVPLLGHDAAAVFLPELGQWVYQDPTFNEEYLLDGLGTPLSPDSLLQLTTAGQAGRLRARQGVPWRSDIPYGAGTSYIASISPAGMVIVGSQLNRRRVGALEWDGRSTLIDVPALDMVPEPWSDPRAYVRVTREEAFPFLGPIVDRVEVADSVAIVLLDSTFPGHDRFERRVAGGNWESVSGQLVLPVGACRVEVRSRDSVGNASAATLLDVWVPRGEEFLDAGFPGSLREQATFCTSPP